MRETSEGFYSVALSIVPRLGEAFVETSLAARKGTADGSGDQACAMAATESHRSSGAAFAATDCSSCL